MKHLLLISALLLGVSPVGAQQTVEEIPPPPPIEADDMIEPEITIRDGKEETVYEYRRNGKLIMVRVQPSSGPAYYFFDADGDGVLEQHDDDPRKNPTVQWMLLQW